MKNITTTLLLLCALFVGLSLLLYPTVSDYWNSFRQSKAIASYVDEVASMDENKYQELWESARAYNESLTTRTNVFLLSDEQQAAYESLLNISGTAKGITIETAKYLLDNGEISCDYQYGVSNEVLPGKTASVRVAEGELLLIRVRRDA